LYTEVFRWSMRHRLSRNPMYIGVIDVLLVYALAVEIAVQLRVLVSGSPGRGVRSVRTGKTIGPGCRVGSRD